MKRSAAVGLAILSGAVTFCQAQYLSLANVRRIYVGKLGDNDDAERFRAVGARELEHAGFGTASQAKDADAILRPRFHAVGRCGQALMTVFLQFVWDCHSEESAVLACEETGDPSGLKALEMTIH